MKKKTILSFTRKSLLKTFLLILTSSIVISCSLEPDSPFPSTNNPTPITPDMIFTQAKFKTNFSGTYDANPNAVLDLGIYDIKFSDGYAIETSLLTDNLFVFSIIYTNNTLAKGIQKIVFTNGMWDGIGNYQSLEISSSEKGSMNNLILTLIEDPSKYYSWRESIQANGTNLYFLGTNIGTKQ